MKCFLLWRDARREVTGLQALAKGNGQALAKENGQALARVTGQQQVLTRVTGQQEFLARVTGQQQVLAGQQVLAELSGQVLARVSGQMLTGLLMLKEARERAKMLLGPGPWSMIHPKGKGKDASWSSSREQDWSKGK